MLRSPRHPWSYILLLHSPRTFEPASYEVPIRLTFAVTDSGVSPWSTMVGGKRKPSDLCDSCGKMPSVDGNDPSHSAWLWTVLHINSVMTDWFSDKTCPIFSRLKGVRSRATSCGGLGNYHMPHFHYFNCFSSWFKCIKSIRWRWTSRLFLIVHIVFRLFYLLLQYTHIYVKVNKCLLSCCNSLCFAAQHLTFIFCNLVHCTAHPSKKKKKTISKDVGKNIYFYTDKCLL